MASRRKEFRDATNNLRQGYVALLRLTRVAADLEVLAIAASHVAAVEEHVTDPVGAGDHRFFAPVGAD
jgi:hypothetical protein